MQQDDIKSRITAISSRHPTTTGASTLAGGGASNSAHPSFLVAFCESRSVASDIGFAALDYTTMECVVSQVGCSRCVTVGIISSLCCSLTTHACTLHRPPPPPPHYYTSIITHHEQALVPASLLHPSPAKVSLIVKESCGGVRLIPTPRNLFQASKGESAATGTGTGTGTGKGTG